MTLCKQRGYALVSIDYRLAPEAPIADIIKDVEDAMQWIRSEGPKQAQLDPTRMVVSGGSAGGYLTMMVGFRVKPPVTALVAYWGYGDCDGDWYTKPSKHYRESMPLISKEDAYKGIGTEPITGTRGREQQRARGLFYRYLRQNGLWAKVVAGYQGKPLDAYSPVRNITANYPPILMIHGTADTDVPYSKSADMAKQLAVKKVAHELITVKDAGHGLGGGDRDLIQQAHGSHSLIWMKIRAYALFSGLLRTR